MSQLKINLLGYPQITLGQTSLQELPAKAQALLYYLAVTKQQFSREHLAELLWSNEKMPLDKKLNNLRGAGALLALNKSLADFLVVHRHSLAFRAESDFQLDVDIFESALREPNPTAGQLQTAVNLYRDDFLAGLNVRQAFGFDDWVQRQRERLRRLAMNALYLQAVHYKQQRQYHAGIDCITRLLTLEPYFEEAHRELMLLLALTGQVSEGCAHYERYWDTLAEEGLEPEPETAAVYRQLLAGDIPADVEPQPVIAGEPRLTWTPPFQPPPSVPHFVGRSVIQQDIHSALHAAGRPPIQAIVGMGGVGKSSLAIEIAQAAQPDFPDGILWASVATSEPTAVIESWAAAYGYDFSRIGDLESMANAFRGVLADKQVLIVLDDVSSVARIRPLLPNGPAVRVLITTRDHDLAYAVDGEVWLLEELSPANGRALLANILGAERVTAEAEAAAAICELLQNLPLALEIIGQRLKSRPRRRLADVVQRLRDEKKRLSVLQISDREVRASFALSYATLDGSLQEMFALMGLFHGRSFTAETLAAIAEQDRYEAEDRIFALVALSLAQEEGDVRYIQHPLLSDFARERLVEEEDVGGVYGRFAHTYRHFAQQHQHNYDALRPEWDNLMAAMQAAHEQQLWPTVIDFADALHDAWFARGRYTQARQGYQWALEAAKHEKQEHMMANYLRQWGLACLEQRNVQEAQEHLNESNKFFSKLQDQGGIAQNECDLAGIAIEMSNYDLAKKRLSTSRSLRKNLNDMPGIAEAYHVEARMNYFQGNHDETIRLGNEALEILENAGLEEKTIRTLSLLASAFIMQDDYESGEIYAQKALGLAHKFQAKGDIGVILNVLSYNAFMQRNLDKAQKYGEQGLELLQTVGDLGSQAMILYHLGLINREKKQHDLALQYGLKSLALCQQSQFNLQTGWTLTLIAKSYESLADPAKADKSWKEAQALAQSIQHPGLLNYINQNHHHHP